MPARRPGLPRDFSIHNLRHTTAPTKLDLDIEKKEATIVITPDMIERIEKYERMKARMDAGTSGYEGLLVK